MGCHASRASPGEAPRTARSDLGISSPKSNIKIHLRDKEIGHRVDNWRSPTIIDPAWAGLRRRLLAGNWREGTGAAPAGGKSALSVGRHAMWFVPAAHVPVAHHGKFSPSVEKSPLGPSRTIPGYAAARLHRSLQYFPLFRMFLGHTPSANFGEGIPPPFNQQLPRHAGTSEAQGLATHAPAQGA